MKTFLQILFAFALCVGLLYSRPYEYKLAKPNQQFGSRLINKGQLFSKEVKSIEYISGSKREWFIYSPPIHRKPKRHGLPKR